MWKLSLVIKKLLIKFSNILKYKKWHQKKNQNYKTNCFRAKFEAKSFSKILRALYEERKKVNNNWKE